MQRALSLPQLNLVEYGNQPSSQKNALEKCFAYVKMKSKHSVSNPELCGL